MFNGSNIPKTFDTGANLFEGLFRPCQGHQVWWEAPDSPPTVVSGKHLRHGGQKKLYGFELVNWNVEKGLKVQKLWSPNIKIGVEKPDFKETGIWPSQRSSFLMLVFFFLLNCPCSWWLTAVFPAFDRSPLPASPAPCTEVPKLSKPLEIDGPFIDMMSWTDYSLSNTRSHTRKRWWSATSKLVLSLNLNGSTSLVSSMKGVAIWSPIERGSAVRWSWSAWKFLTDEPSHNSRILCYEKITSEVRKFKKPWKCTCCLCNYSCLFQPCLQGFCGEPIAVLVMEMVLMVVFCWWCWVVLRICILFVPLLGLGS